MADGAQSWLDDSAQPMMADLLASVPAPVATPARGDVSLALYDSMCQAIDAAYAVDEVKDIRDRALAFEVYARQAKNIEAERRACEIRLRAERKAGSLLVDMDKAKGQRLAGRTADGQPVRLSNDTTAELPTLADLGVTRDQSSKWQRLAEVPQERFEEALGDPDKKPTTAGIIAAATPPKPDVVPVSKDALWLWGRLTDFERHGLLDRDPADVLLTMTPQMLDDAHRLAPRVANWLNQIGRTT